MGGFKPLLAFSVAALVGASAAGIAATRAGDDQNRPSSASGALAERCLVQVDRVAPSGSFSVTRMVRDDGKCVCFAKTGPKNQGGDAELSVAGLLKSGSCADAPPAIEETAASAGGLGGGLLGGLGASVAAGAAAAAAGGSASPQ